MNVKTFVALAALTLVVVAPTAMADPGSDQNAPLSDCVNPTTSPPYMPYYSVSGCRDFVADLIDPDP
jgi:hypothetical protein